MSVLTLYFNLLQFKHNRRLQISYFKLDATLCIWNVVSRKKWHELLMGALGALMDEKVHFKWNWLINQKLGWTGLVCNYKCWGKGEKGSNLKLMGRGECEAFHTVLKAVCLVSWGFKTNLFFFCLFLRQWFCNFTINIKWGELITNSGLGSYHRAWLKLPF